MKLYLIAVLVACVICLILGKITIPLLKKLNSVQPILNYVKEHFHKQGTPTMGGTFFLIATLITFVIFLRGSYRLSLIAVAVTISFGIVGFIDDFIKIKFKNNAGLTPIQKILFQISIAIIVSIVAYFSGITGVYVPFTSVMVDLGVFSILLNVFVFIATVNSVNLTDGLDGLASSVSIVYLITITTLINIQTTVNANMYVNFKEYENLSLFSLCLAGALIGYLAFNSPKASVFMGDCGSLAIGGAIASISIFTANTLYIPVIGITFLISAISVIIQVVYYKKTKKRVFLMAPLHHHFQHKGYSEAKISFSYALVTFIISVIVIICVL